MIRPESNLRSDKKRRTRALILENAVALFRRSGIRNTRTMEIAKASRVSPATLFNYFATKNDLAEAWVRGEIREALDELASVSGERGIRSGLRSRCPVLAMASCVEPRLRLEAWRSAGRAIAPGSRSFGPFAHWIEREQDRARLRADLPASVLAELLADAIEAGLIAGLRESKDPLVVAARLRSRIDLVLDGARKRNERVRAPVRSIGS